uniref:Putative secreted protein n=1 Tax=Ixodes ricinus TaxID=34613 RepID=A0A6B0UHN5_IXORI
MSDMKEVICFMRRSMLLSLPVFSRVVMARVAIDRFTSVIRFSRSRLHDVTAAGCAIATLFRVRTAAKRRVGFGELQKSWRMETAGVSSRAVVERRLTIACAAS